MLLHQRLNTVCCSSTNIELKGELLGEEEETDQRLHQSEGV